MLIFLFISKDVNAREIAGVHMDLSKLIFQCAPTVAPETMAAIISAESRGSIFAIADAGPVHLPWEQRKKMVRSFHMGSVDQAVEKAEGLLARGHTVSLGLAQINDRNLKKYGVSVRQIFDPCTNISIGGKILTEIYSRAVRKFGSGAAALNAAFSAFNSGDWHRGERDGYVSLVYKQVGRPLIMTATARRPIGTSQGRKSSEKKIVSYSHKKDNSDNSERSFTMTSREFIINN